MYIQIHIDFVYKNDLNRIENPNHNEMNLGLDNRLLDLQLIQAHIRNVLDVGRQCNENLNRKCWADDTDPRIDHQTSKLVVLGNCGRHDNQLHID